MKKLSLIIYMFVFGFAALMAQADIKFDSISHDLGKFPEDEPIQKCVFTFTNTGNEDLVILQASASCGCTVPNYNREPIKPGEDGKIYVTYNSKGKFPGRFKKSITIRSNAKHELVRIYIEGEMVAVEKSAEPAQ